MRRILEALLFAADQPLPLRKMHQIVSTHEGVAIEELQQCLEELAEELRTSDRAFQLDEIAGGYLLRSKPEFSPYIEQLEKKRAGKISQAAAEVLAIIAHKQPVSRAEIEAIRGVDCSYQLQSLTERELIEIRGKLEVPGRPVLYGVTERFLIHFGLNDIKDLQKSDSIVMI